jgi:flagellar motor switch protein FliG
MADESMTGLQKVAVLLKSLPSGMVDKVLKHMDPRQSKMLAGEVSRMATDPRLAEKLSHVLAEAEEMLGDSTSKPTSPAAVKNTASPLAAAKPKHAMVDTVIDFNVDDAMAARSAPVSPPARDVPGDVGTHANPVLALAEIPVEQLVAALESENARTIFILMESLKIDIAGQIYKLLSPAKRKEVSQRFAEKVTVNEQLTKQIAQGVLKKCQALRNSTSANAEEERQQRMAALLNGLERTERMETLAMLEKTDAALIERVKNLLYQFEVIARMENMSIQKLLSDVNMQALAVALKGAPAEIEERIMANLSKRAQETLREEISLVGNVTPAKVREARQGIVLVIQQLDQRGEFVLREA